MQSRASAPIIMKTIGVRIFQRQMAKQVGEKLLTCSALSTGCRHVRKGPWHNDTDRKQADTLNAGESRATSYLDRGISGKSGLGSPLATSALYPPTPSDIYFGS